MKLARHNATKKAINDIRKGELEKLIAMANLAIGDEFLSEYIGPKRPISSYF